MAAIASSATSVLIAHVAAHTSTIRLGAGGVMLPNHSPLTIAEQFGTLETLHPGRIDLGLGRAPGSDQNTMRALRRDAMSAERFPQDVLELQGYLTGHPDPRRRGHPRRGDQRAALHPGLVAVRCAAGRSPRPALRLRLPLRARRAAGRRRPVPPRVQASDQLAEPYVIAGVNVIAAEDGAYATEQFETMRRSRVRWMISRAPSAPDYSDEEIDAFLITPEGRSIANMMPSTRPWARPRTFARTSKTSPPQPAPTSSSWPTSPRSWPTDFAQSS